LVLNTRLPLQADFLIIGGGIIGMTISLELKTRFPDTSIVLLEKEQQTGQHASGRNSGVLHAGFYYTANSLKARLTREGNRAMTDYCIEHKLPINRCGKLVVTSNQNELAGLHELIRRGRVNRVDVHLLSASEAGEIEPKARTFEQALYSPTTSTISPVHVNESLYQDTLLAGIRILTGTAFISSKGSEIKTSKGMISAGYVINAAGLYADHIARSFGFSKDYTILPFKGLSLYSENNAESFRCNIYPVPDMNNPFLGVHITVGVDGVVKIGPTALPAFWRENYQGLDNFQFSELIKILGMEARLLVTNNSGFRKLAMEELSKARKNKLVLLASRLAEGVRQKDFMKWSRPGIRAQLLNTKTMTLEMDFCFEGDDRSFHILNAVSPAYTCAFPFSKLVVDEIGGRLK
jgi:L-2-hydroxyglutarate oxidase LhgO